MQTYKTECSSNYSNVINYSRINSFDINHLESRCINEGGKTFYIYMNNKIG